MSAPLCPVHGSPMQQGRKGFYCTKKAGPGEAADANGYCAARAKAETPTPASVPGPTAAAPSLHAAALRFAGDLYHGLGPQFEDQAVECAVRALERMRAL